MSARVGIKWHCRVWVALSASVANNTPPPFFLIVVPRSPGARQDVCLLTLEDHDDDYRLSDSENDEDAQSSRSTVTSRGRDGFFQDRKGRYAYLGKASLDVNGPLKNGKAVTFVLFAFLYF